MTQPTSQPSSASATSPQKHLSPLERLRRGRQRSFWIRLIGGLTCLLLLFIFIQAGLSWTSLLLIWVMLTFFADEANGYFGYIAALMGLLILGAPGQDPEQWKILLPLTGGALLASLIVKHSGGWLVLPFAAAVFILPFYAASEYGHLLDPNLLALGDPELMRAASVGMVIGLGVSFARQFVIWLVEMNGIIRERQLLKADGGPKAVAAAAAATATPLATEEVLFSSEEISEPLFPAVNADELPSEPASESTSEESEAQASSSNDKL